jgi:hypothetical protein
MGWEAGNWLGEEAGHKAHHLETLERFFLTKISQELAPITPSSPLNSRSHRFSIPFMRNQSN